ncbi:hypothetical protein VTK73DRAFT_9731 [Phialemonium thermophilum]|uniref:Zn(2)-C6 fungal-type domain-containing protein n=1 Tax=Phialemonium thermophilum TaxID=223376 RepID=A0ABR3W0Y5_9PEZI
MASFPEPALSATSQVSPTQSSSDTMETPQSTNSHSSNLSATNGDGTRASQGPPPSVPAACLACRAKHLKCDGLNPCSRCTSSSSECVYVASRRGYKGPRRNTAANPNKRHASSSPSPSTSASGSVPDNCPMLLGHAPVSLPNTTAISAFNPAIVLPQDTQPPSPFTNPALANLQVFRNPFANGGTGGAGAGGHPHAHHPATRSNLDALNSSVAARSSSALQPTPSLPDRCFDMFYQMFHAGHPFVLPKHELLRLIKEGTTKLDALLAAIRYIGSLYVDNAGPARAHFLEEAVRLCFDPAAATPKDGFLVQALLLVIIGLDGSCQQERARELLSDCERIALEINLNTRPFATMHGRGNPVLEESWRRTWWDLYVCDGMIAGVHRVTNFLLFDIQADVALPCEEEQYLSGDIPQPPMYIEDFDDQLFSGEERPFSSFAYRIAAARNLGRFMRTPTTIYPGDENVAKVEALLTNWRIHLPENKRYNIDKNCQLDEMMFQAHFITFACTIMLHQPLSQLDSSPTRAVTSCAPHRQVASGHEFNSHTQFTVTAACEISKMITQPVPLLRHTHFFTCVVTLSSIVHLSKWAALYYLEDEDDLRQLIRLNVGALARLSAVWKAANTACGQVKGVAQEIYRAKKAQQINPAFWVGFTQEQMISSLNADEGIMSDFNSMLSQVTTAPP